MADGVSTAAKVNPPPSPPPSPRPSEQTRKSVTASIANNRANHNYATDAKSCHQKPKFALDEVNVEGVDARDAHTPDNWVPRHPDMIRLTGKHPFNAEPPLSTLISHGFFTPSPLHYVRNHGYVPKLEWDTHTLTIDITEFLNSTSTSNSYAHTDPNTPPRPPSENPPSSQVFRMPELSKLFRSHEFPLFVACDGNRRKEQNLVKRSIGFSWGSAAVSNAIWKGWFLRDVLTYCGLKYECGQECDEETNGSGDSETRCEVKWFVCFEGYEDLPKGKYGTSIPLDIVMDPRSDILIAFEMNAAPLLPDHGYPIRIIIPGYIGGRMVKWLTRITVSKSESPSHYHFYDNRVLPTAVESAEMAESGRWWFKPEFIINEQNINSVITTPPHNETLHLSPPKPSTGSSFDHDSPAKPPEAALSYTFRGYAYTGGGRPVSRVELSFNRGIDWELADLSDVTRRYARHQGTRFWCWWFWELNMSLEELRRRLLGKEGDVSGKKSETPVQTREIWVRAWDGQNTQPERLTWNLLGMMNNCYFRVRCHIEKDGEKGDRHDLRGDEEPKGLVIRFEHPTLPGPQKGGWMMEDKDAGTLSTSMTILAPPAPSEAEKPPKEKHPQAQRPFKPENTFTPEEVDKHTSAKSCWIIHDNRVYDPTPFLKDHPGGAESILMNAGTDATEEFDAIHSQKAHELLEKYYIGDVAGDGQKAKGSETEKKGEERNAKEQQQTGEGGAPSALTTGAPPKTPPAEKETGEFLNPRSYLPVVLYDRIELNHDTRIFRFAFPPSAPHSKQHQRLEPFFRKHAHKSLEETKKSWIESRDCGCLGLPVGKHLMLMLEYEDDGEDESKEVRVMGDEAADGNDGKQPEKVKKVIRPYTPISSSCVCFDAKGWCNSSPDADDEIPLTCTFDLLIKVYFPTETNPGGLMTTHLDKVRTANPTDPPDLRLKVKGPAGSIEYKGNGVFSVMGDDGNMKTRETERVLLIAGGTGITPCWQVIKAVMEEVEKQKTRHSNEGNQEGRGQDAGNVGDGANTEGNTSDGASTGQTSVDAKPSTSKQTPPRLWLIYSNRTERDILLRRELDTYASRHPSHFRLWYTLTGAVPKDWKYGSGRISTDMFEGYGFGGERGGKEGVGKSKSAAFLCGPDGMVHAGVEALKRCGFGDEEIFVF